MSILGTKKDGSVSECKASPENRGKGKCKHFEHTEIDSNKINDYIKTRNEEKLKKISEILLLLINTQRKTNKSQKPQVD